MADQSISEIIYTMMSLLFLLLGIVLLVSIVMSTINPYEQIAFANVEKLRAGMNEACIDQSRAVTMKLDLPQNTPKSLLLFTVMPVWLIRANGDPNYVLYYESFPAGDATGWEIYHGMYNRLVSPLPENYQGKNSDQVHEYATSLVDEWKNVVVSNANINFKPTLEGVIVNNIVLNNYGPIGYHFSTPQSSGASSNIAAMSVLDSTNVIYGDWKVKDTFGVPTAGDNEFAFNNYRSLTAFEKTSLKYSPCGEGSLCLKTRSGVYKFPMEQCEDAGIKYIELKYDARDRKTVYAGVAIATAVVVGGAVILGAGGAVAGTVGTGGVVSAETLAAAAPVAPGVYAATVAGETIPVFTSVAADGAIVAYTTPAATSAASGTLLTIIRSFASKGWGIAKGFVGFIMKSPAPIPQTVGAGATAGAGISVYKIGEFLAGAFLSYKVEDFNIASPCSISAVTVKQVKCQRLDCTRFISYPIYEYETDGKLKDTGKKHYACVEKIFGVDEQGYLTGTLGFISPSSSFGRPKNEIFTPEDNCLQVIVEEKADGFCWTPDPYKESWFSDTQYVANTLQFFPIKQRTTYLPGSDSTIVLKYDAIGTLESWKDWFERKLSWGWPG